MDLAHDRNQIRQLHLLRDERDRELLTAAQSRAGNAVLRVSQLLAAICLLRGETVWTALLSLTFVNAAARCFHQFRCDRERAYLLLGLAAGAVALGLCSVFLIKGEAALGMVTALSWPLFSLLGFPTPGRLALIFFVAAGGHLVRAFSDQREELISKLLRLKS